MASDRYPRKESLLLAWARQHATVWAGGQSGPPDIGLSAAQLVSFDNAVTSAETAFSEQTAALSASRSSTENKNDAFDVLLAQIGSTMATIDAYFKTTDDPGVYTRAQIDPPKPPSPRAAPPKPVELDLVSFPDGTLRLSFKVTAAGSVFEIQRITTDAEGQEGEWATIAVTGDKMYTDPSVPRGLRRVEYRVRAVLPNNQASEWSTPVPFNFGSQGSEGGPMAAAEAA
ncbi:MAG: hypothetical protein NCW75_03380 [Phycisphaera sp.]|nr:MAG: hypothetical protein NCW75_03380 [Phycisphaera sp.]